MGRWDGRNLRIVYPRQVFPYMSFYNDSQTGQLRVHGMFGSLLGNITQSLNMTYELFKPEDGRFGTPQIEPEKMNGQLAMVWKGDVDVALGPWEIREELFMHFHLAPIIGTTKIAIWHSMKKMMETKSTPYVNAFDSQVWLFLWISMIVLSILCTIEECVIYGKRLGVVVIYENVIIMMQTLLQESTKNRFMTITGRVVGAIWLIATYIIMTSFSGELKANSVVQQPTLRLNSYDDIYFHRSTHKLLYPLGSPTTALMNEATGISGERLRKAMAEGEAKINADIYNEESLRELLAERVVIICEYYSILYLTSKMCKTTKNFFHVSHETMREIRISIVVGRHLEPDLIAEIDRKIQIIKSMGVPFISDRETFPGSLKCLTGRRQNAEIHPLTYTDIAFSFDSHLVGLACCTLVFFIEILSNALEKKESRKTKRNGKT